MRYSIDKEQDRYRVSSISENPLVGLLESMEKQRFSESLLQHVHITPASLDNWWILPRVWPRSILSTLLLSSWDPSSSSPAEAVTWLPSISAAIGQPRPIPPMLTVCHGQFTGVLADSTLAKMADLPPPEKVSFKGVYDYEVWKSHG